MHFAGKRQLGPGRRDLDTLVMFGSTGLMRDLVTSNSFKYVSYICRCESFHLYLSNLGNFHEMLLMQFAHVLFL